MGEEKIEEESGERAMKGKIALVVVGYNRPASMNTGVTESGSIRL